jgi:hypothetical protein
MWYLLSSNPLRNPAEFLLLGLAMLYLGLLAAPGSLFAENARAGGVSVYTHGSTAGILPDVELAEKLLSRSPLNDVHLRQSIYLTQSTPEYAFFAPGSVQSFGITFALFADSFLAPSDPVADTIRANRSSYNLRPLSAVLAHERMHVLLSHHFGLMRTWLAPTWKQEGIASTSRAATVSAITPRGCAYSQHKLRPLPRSAIFETTCGSSIFWKKDILRSISCSISTSTLRRSIGMRSLDSPEDSVC